MQVTTFPSKTTPYRIQLPGRYSPDGKRKTRYFKTREDAETFLRRVKKLGLAAIDNKPAPTPKQRGAMAIDLKARSRNLGQ
jgi:hypothetical protein